MYLDASYRNNINKKVQWKFCERVGQRGKRTVIRFPCKQFMKQLEGDDSNGVELHAIQASRRLTYRFIIYLKAKSRLGILLEYPH